MKLVEVKSDAREAGGEDSEFDVDCAERKQSGKCQLMSTTYHTSGLIA